MKSLIILTAIIATSYGKPWLQNGPTDVDVTQDTAGNYRYIIDSNNYKKLEERYPDGSVIGFYSYIDANGELITYKYVSGPNGFKIIDGPLPVAPLPVAEDSAVLEKRKEHLGHFNTGASNVPTPNVDYQSNNFLPQTATFNSFRSPQFSAPSVSIGNSALQPVRDTPEVEAAKQAHFAAHRAHLQLLNH